MFLERANALAYSHLILENVDLPMEIQDVAVVGIRLFENFEALRSICDCVALQYFG